MYTEKAATETLRSAKIDEILSNVSRIVNKPKSSDNGESGKNSITLLSLYSTIIY
jgi:hypothetical protein